MDPAPAGDMHVPLIISCSWSLFSHPFPLTHHLPQATAGSSRSKMKIGCGPRHSHSTQHNHPTTSSSSSSSRRPPGQHGRRSTGGGPAALPLLLPPALARLPAELHPKP